MRRTVNRIGLGSVTPSVAILFLEGEGMKKFRDVIKETRRTAIMNPLNRNKDSEYFNVDGTPCCIFGHVLERLGIDFNIVFVESNSYSICQLPWETWGFETPNFYESMWVMEVQTRADQRKLWPIAITMADMSLI